MLYLIGLGLNEKGISLEGKETLEKCSKIYLENYTVDFPYSFEGLENSLGKKMIKLGRKEVESDFLIREAKKENICLLVYGSPLFATTHMSLIEEAIEKKISFEVIYSASVFEAVGEAGLQMYKFGKIASLPDWKDKGKTFGFADIVKSNLGIKAHTLILSDIKLNFKEALEQLKTACTEKKIKLDKIIVCSQLGTPKRNFYYADIKILENKEIKMPFCFIIPSELHFLEKQVLERFNL